MDKTKPAEKSAARNWGGRALPALGALLLLCLVYIAAVLIQSPADTQEGSFVVEEEKEAVTRMQPASSGDAQALSQLFGAPLPALPLPMDGRAENASHDGETARLVTLRYDGAVITAVRPASAAPLLLRSELSVSTSGETVLNLPALLARKGDARCLYFSNESAAYSVYTETEEAFNLLSQLFWAR